MRKILIVLMAIMANYTLAQTNLNKKPIERKGFVIGLGLGAGVLNLKTNDTTNLIFSPTLPNIKIGFMMNNRLAFFTLLPGVIYKYNGNDRGFEGIQIAGQYWIKNNWWELCATGLTFDAPAFYTVKDPKTAAFYIGMPSLSFATGYEAWHKG